VSDHPSKVTLTCRERPDRTLPLINSATRAQFNLAKCPGAQKQVQVNVNYSTYPKVSASRETLQRDKSRVYLKKKLFQVSFIHLWTYQITCTLTCLGVGLHQSVSGGRDIATKQPGSDRRQREARQDPLSPLLTDKP
jgi:hypothetical protein